MLLRGNLPISWLEVIHRATTLCWSPMNSTEFIRLRWGHSLAMQRKPEQVGGGSIRDVRQAPQAKDHPCADQSSGKSLQRFSSCTIMKRVMNAMNPGFQMPE